MQKCPIIMLLIMLLILFIMIPIIILLIMLIIIPINMLLIMLACLPLDCTLFRRKHTHSSDNFAPGTYIDIVYICVNTSD